MPLVCVMHRSRIRRATQGNQKAQGQNGMHRFFSDRWPRLLRWGSGRAVPTNGGLTNSHIGGIAESGTRTFPLDPALGGLELGSSNIFGVDGRKVALIGGRLTYCV